MLEENVIPLVHPGEICKGFRLKCCLFTRVNVFTQPDGGWTIFHLWVSFCKGGLMDSSQQL